MVVQQGLWRKLSDVFNSQEAANLEVRAPQSELDAIYPYSSEQIARAKLKAQKEWFGAIAALQQLLLSSIDASQTDLQGSILSAPAPVLSYVDLISRFQTGIFMPQALKTLALMPCQQSVAQQILQHDITGAIAELPLLPNDPIASEQFCLALTSKFGLLMVLGEDATGLPTFQFSFEPETIERAWSLLRSRLYLAKYHQLQQLDRTFEKFRPPTPDYRLVTNFSHLLLKHLPELPTLETKKTRAIETVSEKNGNIFPFANRRAKQQSQQLDEACATDSPDIELLQALTHEIRTPLTTIRTMTRLLLKRSSELSPEIVKRLETIDQECTEQINRMELIFRAAEFKTSPVREKQVQLVPISLEQVFQRSIPLWQKQAQRRSVELDVVVPKKLPQVVSDPAMLDQVLTGLMEKFIRSLPTGGQIQVRVTTAGNQLKLQFYTQSVYQDNALKALGQLLMFQPETGSLSLSLDVTKNLFNALGGKLIVRQRPQQGEVLTIFLPLGGERSKGRI
ncbi:MAG: sensor histidine kinase [Hydrococcus sp. C42_A2020_068]|uniref:sensor histidine kinase n=1 Tax=Pleurocapsa sp. PCC 7327 TaxID=118163 RepID=UPI00029F82AA|nr:HAMP domain-containing sensor histidine kinase [Pleurocapsa sp. PCC 7327]AFY78370.1 histidine kinase [Pleurocapsa sp. PCC 7327]MBF2022178.1 sensor histidine kinase [Hydrococcus sp. C42_A2020_068]